MDFGRTNPSRNFVVGTSVWAKRGIVTDQNASVIDGVKA